MINIKLTCKLINRDLKYGFHKCKNRYISFIILILLITLMESINMKPFEVDPNHIFFNIFKGVEYGIEANPKDYQFPFKWLVINGYMIFIFGSYFYEDYKQNSLYVFTRTESINEYIISKAISLIIGITFGYLIIFIIIFILSSLILYGDVNLQYLSDKVSIPTLQQETYGLRFISIIFLLQISTTISVSFIQTFMSFLIKPQYGYLLVLTLFCISVYVSTNFFPGSHSMILRHTLFDNLHKLSIIKSIIYNLSVSLIAIIGCFVHIKRNNII